MWASAWRTRRLGSAAPTVRWTPWRAGSPRDWSACWRSPVCGLQGVKSLEVASMQRTHVDLARDRSRGIDALMGTEVPAVYSDAVRVDLSDCSLLYISGMIGVNAEGKVVDRTIKGQTRQVLENIKRVLDHEGATFDDVVRV